MCSNLTVFTVTANSWLLCASFVASPSPSPSSILLALSFSATSLELLPPNDIENDFFSALRAYV
jgi:hypothetical protein